MRPALLLLAACASEPPEIRSIEPATGSPGDAITITGDHFGNGTKVKLGGEAIDDLTIEGPTTMKGTVPDELEPGTHVISVTSSAGKTAQMARAFTVAEPQRELELCAEGWAGYAKTMLEQKRIRIARFKKSEPDKPQITELDFRDIAAVEYEGHAREGGVYCSAIVLRLEDGRRVIFEDATETNLKTKAQNFSQTIGRPVDLVHEDPETEEPTP